MQLTEWFDHPICRRLHGHYKNDFRPNMCTEERPQEDTERRHHLQAKERDLKRHQIYQHLDLELLVSRTERKITSGVLVSNSVELRYGSFSRLRKACCF